MQALTAVAGFDRKYYIMSVLNNQISRVNACKLYQLVIYSLALNIPNGAEGHTLAMGVVCVVLYYCCSNAYTFMLVCSELVND